MLISRHWGVNGVEQTAASALLRLLRHHLLHLLLLLLLLVQCEQGLKPLAPILGGFPHGFVLQILLGTELQGGFGVVGKVVTPATTAAAEEAPASSAAAEHASD